MRNKHIEDLASSIVADFTDGDVLSHEWLHTALDIVSPDFRGVELIEAYRRSAYIADLIRKHQFNYMAQIEELREELLEEHNVALKNVRGEGYRLIPPKEQTNLAMDTLKRDVNLSVKKCQKLLVNIRVEQLDSVALKENTDAVAKLSFFNRLSKRRLLEI